MTDALEEIRAFRKAARTIVRSPALDEDQKDDAIIRLAQRALVALTPGLSLMAVVEECRERYGLADSLSTPEAPVGPPEERVLHALLNEGYAKCPTCRRWLPSRDDLRRWRALHQARIDELERREKAVS